MSKFVDEFSFDDIENGEDMFADPIDDYWSDVSNSDDVDNAPEPDIRGSGAFSSRASKPQKSDSDSKLSLGYKSVAVIIAVAFIILALFFGVIGSIRLKSKDTSSKSSSTMVPSTVVSSVDSVSLNIVGDSVAVDYGVGIVEVPGVIFSKSRYAYNGQLFHCLNIVMETGSVQYFCSYNTYKSINVGDAVNVFYQQVSSATISIYDVSRR